MRVLPLPPVALLVLINCSTADSVCSKQADCLSWNSARQDACEEEFEGAGEVADEYDCTDQFDALIACIDETGSCKVEQKGNVTEHRFDSACGGQNEALERCEKAARDAPR